MRTGLCLLGVLLVGFGSAEAARRVTPEQLATMVAEAQTGHKSDAALVRELADVELTARVSEAAAKQMMAAAPGAKSAEALRALVDESVWSLRRVRWRRPLRRILRRRSRYWARPCTTW